MGINPNPDTFRRGAAFDDRMNILNAVEELAKTTDYDSITVMAICKQASISRQTFYRLFDGKAAVFQWFVSEVFGEFMSEVGISLSWSEAMRIPHRLAFKRANIARAVFSSNERDSSIAAVAQIVATSIRRNIESRNRAVITEELQFLITGYGWAFAHSIASWNVSDQAMPPNRLSEYLVGLLPRKLYELTEIEEDLL